MDIYDLIAVCDSNCCPQIEVNMDFLHKKGCSICCKIILHGIGQVTRRSHCPHCHWHRSKPFAIIMINDVKLLGELN